MTEKIKELWGKFLIWIYGIPPSLIAKQCCEELWRELKGDCLDD